MHKIKSVRKQRKDLSQEHPNYKGKAIGRKGTPRAKILEDQTVMEGRKITYVHATKGKRKRTDLNITLKAEEKLHPFVRMYRNIARVMGILSPYNPS